jgi:3-deoxy-D-manno-octulosonic-acid transferase
MGIIKFIYNFFLSLIPLPSQRKIKEIPFENYLYFHASSIGEVMSLKGLIDYFSKDYPCILTTFTKAGKEKAENIFKDKIKVFYFPFDKKGEIEKLVKRAKALIIAECELWPNLIQTGIKNRKKIFLVNGKISKKSFYFYNFIFKEIKKFLRDFELIFLHDKSYEIFFKKLGVLPFKIFVLRNLKYDALEDVKGAWEKNGFTITFGSIRSNEIDIVVNVIQKILNKREDLKIVICPRHLINTKIVEFKLKEKGIDYEKRSKSLFPTKKVFILDTLGELLNVWKISDVGIVGGTFGKHGGHNLAEPAFFGIPVIFGESIQNVKEIANILLKIGGGFKVKNEKELENILNKLILDDDFRKRAGENAKKGIEILRGSSKMIYEKIKETL